ncbi:MAG TPA: ferredoxin, partial [Clostridiales bacterium]|nr:ferredoxin [Clostridiales bacterium]
VQGAIDEVIWDGSTLSYTIIGGNGNGSKARGICGSGLVAAIASLLDGGLIEDTGRINDDEDSLPADLRDRLTKIDGQAAIVIVPAAETADGQPIVLTQKDIRELQNAKAAIAAGIELLVDRAGLCPQCIDKAFIAGGFGNYLDVEHAFRIGLLPPSLLGRTRAAGNTSGMGAVLCLLDAQSLVRASEIISQVEYFELSGDKRFVDLYVDAMMFPENEP